MSSGQILSFLGWGFLPSLATHYLQTFYYRLLTRAGDPLPTPDSPRYARDYKRIYISVVGLYLLYTIYESYYTLRLSPNLYALLNVPPDVTDKALRIQWRRLSLMYHPDKAGSSSDGAGGRGVEEYFMLLKVAYETINNPVMRFAYDRFGPGVLEWGKGIKTAADFVVGGGMRTVPYYTASGLVLLVLSVLGKMEFGRYWRFFSFFALMAFEGFVITRPYTLFSSISFPFQPLLPFEQLILARKIALTFFIALSQIGPYLQPENTQSSTTPTTAAELAASLRPQLAKLEAMSQALEQQAGQAIAAEFMPMQGDEKAVQHLEERLTDYLIESQVRADPGVREAISRVMRRNRSAT